MIKGLWQKSGEIISSLQDTTGLTEKCKLLLCFVPRARAVPREISNSMQNMQVRTFLLV